MTKSQRDSAESLDVVDLEEVTHRDSGLRPLPLPPSKKPSSPPPPIPRAPRALRAADLGYELEAPPPPQRVDMDDLIADLSSRPPPRISPAAGLWEIPSIGPAKRDSIRPPAPAAGKKKTPIVMMIGIGVGAYTLGIVTMLALNGTSTPDPSVVREEIVAGELAEPVITATETSAPAAAEPAAPIAAPVVAPPIAAAPVARRPRRAIAPVERAVEDEAIAAAEAVEEEAAVEPNLPDAPSREDVQRAMSSVRSQIQACAQPADRGQQPVVRFTFISDGRATHAVANGVSGPTASCIARAARAARVPEFSRDRFVVEFPFQL
jgi:hypothetical protein